MKQQAVYDDLFAVLGKSLNILPDKPEENANNTLAALWHLAAGCHVSAIAAETLPWPELSNAQILLLQELVKTRLSGVPLAHLTERQNFMGLEYILNKGNYIPRKETELLAKTAIDTIGVDCSAAVDTNVIDLCCGIGTVALAIAHYCKRARVFGSDIFPPAIISANHNIAHFGLGERARFFEADLFSPFEALGLKNNVSAIVSAPPYISAAKVKNMADEIASHEPEQAFSAGPFGLSIFQLIIAAAPNYLINGGHLIFECGLGQGDFLAKRIDSGGCFGQVERICDEDGNVRVLKARKLA